MTEQQWTADESAIRFQRSAAWWHETVQETVERGDLAAAAYYQQHRARVYRNARAAMGRR